MSLLLKIWAFFCSILFALGGSSESVIGFTDGEPVIPEKTEYCFDDDKLLIGAYYGDINHVKEAKEAGIEFFIDGGVTEEYLDECEKYGIGMIAAGYNFPSAYADFSDAQRDAWVNFDYSKYKDHPALWGDDMIDEPHATAYDNIAAAVKAYYANTSGKLALVNLFPNYANEDQLAEYPEKSTARDFWLATSDNGSGVGPAYKMYVSDYINKIPTDYICVDFYPYYSNMPNGKKEIKSTNGSWLRNLDILAEACRDTGRNLWVITQAAGETKDGLDGKHPRWCDEESDISQQAFISLAFGTKAIIHAEFGAKGWWMPESSHMIDINGNTTETYDAVKIVDGYLASFAKEYGKYTYESTYMMNPVLVAGRDGGPLVTTDPDKVIDIHSVNGLVIGTFSGDDGNAYVVANAQELNGQKTAKFTYKVPDGKTLTVWHKGVSATYFAGSTASISLTPGDGVFMTIK